MTNFDNPTLGTSVKDVPATEKQASIVTNILDGKAKITFDGHSFLEEKVIKGGKWSGTSFVYDIKLPSPSKPGETWMTELKVWAPLPIYSNSHDSIPPETQLFINTGKGEMIFSENSEITKKVIAAIYRQLDESKKAKKIA